MKKRRIILWGLLASCVFFLAGSTPWGEGSAALTAQWAETIQAAEEAIYCGPESVLEDGAAPVTTEQEAAAVLEEYKVGLDEIMTDGAEKRCLSVNEAYLEDVRTREKIIEETYDPDNTFIDTVGFGNFETKVLDYTVDGNVAIMRVYIADWSKRVLTYGDEFEVLFPTGKCISEIHMVLEDGTWKFAGEEIISALLMGSDESLRQVFPTYEEAAAYAASVTPRNVLADETLGMGGY